MVDLKYSAFKNSWELLQVLNKSEIPLSSLDVTEEVPISYSTVARHLRYLKETGVIEVEEFGLNNGSKRPFYGLTEKGTKLCENLERAFDIWGVTLEG